MSFTWKAPQDIFKGEGIYHVTWVVAGRRRILGELQPLGSDGLHAHVVHTELGYRISQDLNALPIRYPGVQVIAKVVMENHIHAVIYVTAEATRHIRQIAHGFRIGITHIAEELGLWQSHPQGHPQSYDLGHTQGHPQGHPQGYDLAVPSSEAAVSIREACHASLIKTAAQPLTPPSLTAAQQAAALTAALTPPSLTAAQQAAAPAPRQLILEQPYIRTLVRRGQLKAMIDYVHSNPSAAYQRRLHPDLYTLRRRVRHGDFLFSTMGKSRLLEWPDKQVIALSRSLPQDRIEEALQQALYRAELGAVTLTGAISPAEKWVARAIREAGFPLVIMLLDGFPAEDNPHAHYFHPGGIYHDTCGKGLLYLMEPDPCCYAHPQLIADTDNELQRKAELKHRYYNPLPHHSKRWRMVAANQLLYML